MNPSKFIGSLVGTAIGDSLGARWEGSYDVFEPVEIGPRYTDDTAMMIGVAESLINSNGFDGDDMSERFVQDFLREPWRGYGSGPPRIFNKILKGHRRWDEMLDKEIYPDGSFGNGAAMRVAPIGLFYYEDIEKLRDIVYKASIITHSHELAVQGAQLEAYAVALAVSTEPPHLNRHEFLIRLRDFISQREYQKKIETIGRLLNEEVNKTEVIKHLGNGIEALNSVPTAIFSFLLNNDFEDAIIYAVSLGGDADTIGAMTGAIAGAYYGIERIPSRWLEGLENREYIMELGERLWKLKRYD